MNDNENKILEDNKIDSTKDTIQVIEAKIEAIRKQREEQKNKNVD